MAPHGYNRAVFLFIGSRSDDPQSPPYIPSMFGQISSKDLERARQQQRRYEALKRREEMQKEAEAAEAQVQPTSSSPSSVHCGECKALEEQYELKLQKLQSEYDVKVQELQVKYESLQEDYRLRVEELRVCKGPVLGRGFPDEAVLKEDEKLTTFYTGLPSFAILMSLFRFVTKRMPEISANHKLTHFQCFLLTLMKVRLGLSNYDLGFRFCVHETTVSRILIKWLQLLDVRTSSLIQWPDREQLQRTMPWCFRPHYGLRVTSIIDCFELFIEKPSDLMSRAVTWSTYKH